VSWFDGGVVILGPEPYIFFRGVSGERVMGIGSVGNIFSDLTD
jgi:hypothetical protein